MTWRDELLSLVDDPTEVAAVVGADPVRARIVAAVAPLGQRSRAMTGANAS